MSIIAAALTAAFNEATGVVQLVATLTDGALNANHGYTLVRADAAGTQSVRTLAGLRFSGDPEAGTYTLVVDDHEPALGGLVTYTLTATDENLNEWVATAAVTPVTDRAWLTFPIFPNYSIELPPVGAYESGHAPRDQYFEVIDRDDVLPIGGPFGQRAGSFAILCPDHAAARQLEEAYRRIRTGYLRLPEPASASLYHRPTRTRLTRYAAGATAWLLTIDYREVGRPAGDVLGTLGWSFADTTALGGTFADSRVTFPTFADRTIGLA